VRRSLGANMALLLSRSRLVNLRILYIQLRRAHQQFRKCDKRSIMSATTLANLLPGDQHHRSSFNLSPYCVQKPYLQSENDYPKPISRQQDCPIDASETPNVLTLSASLEVVLMSINWEASWRYGYKEHPPTRNKRALSFYIPSKVLLTSP
jgi:hypothetical protein